MRYQTAVAATIALVITIAISPGQLTAQESKPEHARYRLIDLGTLGGPNSAFQGFAQVVTNNQVAVGGADTAALYPPNACFNPISGSSSCFIEHAFEWENGTLTDLGALPNGNSSRAFWINDRGQIAGSSENGLVDPLTGESEQRAVLWQDGRIVDLGTLGGNQSAGIDINNGGQVIGATLNTILDPYSIAPVLEAFSAATQTRAFLWENGVMHDLGTLGGPDAFAQLINDRGQVVGLSYTSSVPDPNTGLPPIHPFLWSNGKMYDLGTFGGAFGLVDGFNNLGQVVGFMDQAGDQTSHPFLWDRGKLTDLGTFGGDNGEAIWINDAGDVVGNADLPGNTAHHAFLWTQGVMQDLGVSPGQTCSTAFSINNRRQVVGDSGNCGVGGHPFLWEKGGPPVELNALVPPGSNLNITGIRFINDRGDIAAIARLPNGHRHAVVLVPRVPGEDAAISEAEQDAQSISQAAEVGRAAPVEPPSARERLRAHFRHDH